MKSSNRSLPALLWIMLFDHTCLNITFPILTLLFFDLQSSFFAADTSHAVRSMWYGLCVAVPHIINIIATPILSALSDSFGRRKLLIVGTFGAFLFAVTAGLGVVWGMLGLLFLGRIIQGIFSRTNPIAQAVVGDIAQKENKVLYMGYLQTAISLGAFIGPIIGGYFANQFFFAQMNFALPYFIAALFGGISFVLAIFFFPETLPVSERVSQKHFQFQALKKVFMNKEVLSISVILLLSQISWSLYYQFMPPILKTELGFSAHALGWFVGLIALWLAVATGIGIKVLERFLSLKQMLFAAIYLILFGLLLSLGFCFLGLSGEQTYLMWFAAIPTAVGDVIAYSCLIALYSNAVGKHEQGKVMGVCFIVVALMWAFTGVLGGALMSLYGLLPLIIAPVGILVVIGLLHSRFLGNIRW